MKRSLVWLRRDLRLIDNKAIAQACAKDHEIVLVYLHSSNNKLELGLGEASQWWLHHALADLQNQVTSLGGKLLIVESDSAADTLEELAHSLSINEICWNRRYEPKAVALDTEIKQQLKQAGFTANSYASHLINEPQRVTNKAGKPFQVFTPFWKHCTTLQIEQPASSSATLSKLKLSSVNCNGSIELNDLALLPTVAWDEGMANAWNPTRFRGQLHYQKH